MNEFGWQYTLRKFHENGNVLSTLDFISDIHTAAEYRRILCDLRVKGFSIKVEKITPKHWRYTLLESQPDLLGGEAA